MKPTIKDLAAEFGVDKATVSRALSGKPGVGAKLREKILQRARALGFIPNAQARALATGSTETIALVFCDETSWFFQNPFYSSVLAGIAAEAMSRDFALTFCSLSASAYTPGGPLPKVLAEGRADGFLFVGDQDDNLIKTVAGYGYPLLLVDHTLRGEDLPSVVVENIDGACAAVEHLIGLGHRRIGYVSGSLKSPSFSERLAGYRAALRAHKLEDDPDLVQVGQVGEAGYECMTRMLALKRPPTAVFACNDINAIQAMKAVHDKGLRIPDDVSLIGFDDSRVAADAWPALTTMRVDKQEMGRVAVRELIEMIEGRKSKVRQRQMPAQLVVRDTTAPPRRA